MGIVSGDAPRIAFLFPGQGAQAVGMGKAVFDAFPEARDVFMRADHVLGEPISRLCFEGPAEELRLTANTQPAILTASLAVWAALRSRLGGTIIEMADCMAGHSLGEYTALAAAKAINLEDAVAIVRKRGQYMQDAVPDGDGAMAAVVGVSLEVVERLCRIAAEGDVLAPANLNAPDQTVVAGHTAAVERLGGIARAHGVRKVLRLPVSAPFHCELMRPAAERLARDLESVEIREPAVPIVTNVHAEAKTRSDDLRDALHRQVVAAVRWVESVRAMRSRGVRTVVEVGPGRVLTGLARRIDPELTLVNVENPEGIEAALSKIAPTRGAGR